MKKALFGLGATLCLSISSTAFAANGSIAWNMTRDAHLAARRLEAQKLAKEACGEAKGNVVVACKTDVKVKPAAKT